MPTLTAERLRELLHYDPETGVFTRRVQTCNRVKVGDVCGSPNSKGYLQISIGNRLYLASRLAFLYMTGSWPAGIVDHRDTNRQNNRWLNLRDTTQAVNTENLRRARRDNATGLLGVSPHHGRFRASIGIKGKKHHLGSFDEPSEAHQVYVETKRRAHEGNTL